MFPVPSVQDFLAQADGQAVDCGNVGRRVVLRIIPYLVGHGKLMQLHLDAMAIVCARGPHNALFNTFTCNPDWADIKQAMPRRGNGAYLTSGRLPIYRLSSGIHDEVCRVLLFDERLWEHDGGLHLGD